jgi:NADPH-dependent 2,4-dienoyl-CoA reductase/sulfur reductase-like enzyme
MSAAMQIFKYDKKAMITTLEKGAVYSYAQCGLPYAISGTVTDIDHLMIRSAATFQSKFGMDARTFHKVESIDPEAKMVSGYHTKTGKQFTIPYDKLLIATGADPVVPNWPGRDLTGVHTLKTIPDTEEIMEHIRDGVEEVTIIGGGYIGLEMAESFRQLGKKVRIVNRSEQVAKIFDREMAEYIHEEAANHGIDVLLDENTVAFEGDGVVTGIHTDKGTYATDLVLVATGIRPNTQFLDVTGVKLAKNGAVHVNEFLETNVQDVYAAGDCTLQYHLVKGKEDYIPLGTNANKQGRIAGMNMAGKTRHFKGVVGTSILQFMQLTLSRTGLSERDAEKLGVPYASVTVDAKHIAAYYPGAEKITVKLTYRSDNLLLLGGQVIGEVGVDKRIDVLATALFNQMTIAELEDLDLSYAPPYNGTWDPIQRAARKAMSDVDKQQ